MPDDDSTRIEALLERAPVVDGHNDLLHVIRARAGSDLAAYDIGGPVRGHTDLGRLRRGGVGAQFWAVYVPCELAGSATEPPQGALRYTLEQLDLLERLLERYPETLAPARSVADVRKAWEERRIASLVGVEGGHAVEDSLASLRTLHRLGVRYLTLTHNCTIRWADSATDEAVHRGLTDFGREVVRELNRLGMMVDLSHVSPEVMWDALEVSEAPVIFSHSSARALTDHPRNVPDDVLEAVGEGGGIVMVTFVPKFVSEPVRRAWEAEQGVVDEGRAAEAEGAEEGEGAGEAAIEGREVGRGTTERDGILREQAGAVRIRDASGSAGPRATLADVADHVEHVREVAGAAHVGLGGDFDGTSELPDGLEDVSTYPALLAELARRGWSDEELEALTGGNVLRVMEEVEEVGR